MLCGSGRSCGCAITTVPATGGSINGHYPTIDVIGGGGVDNPWKLTLNPNWVDAVTELMDDFRPPFPPVSWTLAELRNSWVNYVDIVGGNWARAAYRKIGDIVYVQGLIYHSAGLTPPSEAFTLPVGYRPPASLIFVSDKETNTHARTDVRPNGTVTLQWSAGGTSYYGLSDIQFSVTP